MREERIKYLTKDEQRRFFRAIREHGNSRDRCLFSLILHYGLRLQEALNIRLEDIQEKQTRLFVKRLKGGISDTFNLMNEDAKLIRKWMKEREKYLDSDISPYLFITKRSVSGSMTSQGVQFIMLNYCKKAGIPRDKCHPHVLRHSCAVNILMSGQNIYEVKEILGHRSIVSSTKYLELGTPEKRKRLSGVLERAFGKDL